MSRARTISVSILFAASLLSSGSAQQETPARKSTQPKSNASRTTSGSASFDNVQRDVAFALLAEAYETSRNLPSAQKLRLLSRICDTAGSLTRPREINRRSTSARSAAPDISLSTDQRKQLKAWIEDLYAIGDEFPRDAREHMEAQFAASRVMVAVDSKRALQMLDTADVFTNPNKQWNMRDVGSMRLFQSLYRKGGLKAIPMLRRKALQFGEEDDYPFYAVASLLRELKGHPEIVQQFFNDAITAYRRTSEPIRKTMGMVSLLSNREIRSQLAPWQLQDAAEELADQMRRAVPHPDPTGRLPMKAYVVAVKSALNQFAPELSKSIPDLPSSYLAPDTSTQPIQTQSVPEDASTRELRKIFEDSRTAIMELNENDVHDGQQVTQPIDRSIQLGSSLVERLKGGDEKQNESAVQEARRSLRSAVQIGVHVNAPVTLASVRQIQDSAIQAEMLIAVAETLKELR